MVSLMLYTILSHTTGGYLSYTGLIQVTDKVSVYDTVVYGTTLSYTGPIFEAIKRRAFAELIATKECWTRIKCAVFRVLSLLEHEQTNYSKEKY